MSSSTHRQLIINFYSAFQELNAEKMVSCYHDKIHFEDPAFGRLHGDRAKNMWRMLCQSQKGKSFRVEAKDFDASDGKARAHWEAFYMFSKTGRKVHNIIEAEFSFKDDKIIRHVDRFDLYRWSKQAFGMTGVLVGWTPFFKRKLNRMTNQLLDKYETMR